MEDTKIGISARDQYIIDNYKQGKSLRWIGKKLGLSHEWVRQILKDHGVPLASRGGPRTRSKRRSRGFTIQEVEAYFARTSGPLSIRIAQTALAFGITKTQIRCILIRRGKLVPKRLGRNVEDRYA